MCFWRTKERVWRLRKIKQNLIFCCFTLTFLIQKTSSSSDEHLMLQYIKFYAAKLGSLIVFKKNQNCIRLKTHSDEINMFLWHFSDINLQKTSLNLHF